MSEAGVRGRDTLGLATRGHGPTVAGRLIAAWCQPRARGAWPPAAVRPVRLRVVGPAHEALIYDQAQSGPLALAEHAAMSRWCSTADQEVLKS